MEPKDILIDKSLTAEALVKRLENALLKTGDFPVSAQVVTEMRSLIDQPNVTVEQLTQIILKDPTLGIRIISVVNSSFYYRSRPILTVSQAIVHIGLNQLADLCANLVLLKCFVPSARAGGTFSLALRKAILTSVFTELISIEIIAENAERDDRFPRTETGYLLGFFAEMGALLLAFYYPALHSKAVARSEEHGHTINRSLHRLTGVNPLFISIEIVKILNFPEVYAHAMQEVYEGSLDADGRKQLNVVGSILSKACYTAQLISELLVPERRKQELNQQLLAVAAELDIDVFCITRALGKLPSAFTEYCNILELSFAPLPSFLANYQNDEFVNELEKEASIDEDSISNSIKELKSLIENGESLQSGIAYLLETLCYVLHFDRVVLLEYDRKNYQLRGRMGVGNLSDINLEGVQRELDDPRLKHSADILAMNNNSQMITGDPVFAKGWPLVAMPVCTEHKSWVIYGDKVQSTQSELSPYELETLTTLHDLIKHLAIISNKSL